MKIALITTHPIQYQVPWFRKLSSQKNIDLMVYYGMIPSAEQQGTGFNIPFQWDIPLLEGYRWKLLDNRAMSPGLGSFWGINAPSIFIELKKEQPDAVILTGWQSLYLFQALWAAIRLKIPRLVRGESNNLRTRNLWIQLVHRFMLKHFNYFLAIGKGNRGFYLQNGVPEYKIYDTPYFIDNQWFQSHLRNERKDNRSQWGIPSDSTVFLFVGKLMAKKRIMDLMKAAAILCHSDNRFHLLVAGDGELMGSVRSFAQSNGIPATFTGFLNQTEIIKVYAAADCLVLPSDYGETWGLVVNEAMACGLPAIVSDRVGCGPDLVQDGVTGYTFPFGDIDALADRMKWMIRDRERIRKMGRNAQINVLENYSVENAVDGTIKAINHGLSGKKRMDA